MLKAAGFLALAVAAVHFYMLARTGHIDPCEGSLRKA